ncbi:hypothetical protein OWM54_34615 [Myxococcus sp. MISCRS1]|uniref:hypothetical protein n=1 Tax=Myxococcus sp. MISCRS1 TaxID=2996786 RepID=UPI00226F6705|nr:hypothetical protein [Myxococcus sp. MISCRS1]MCY1002299.1 hypothetical protein [Myxococcus sp. MISCRS1]
MSTPQLHLDSCRRTGTWLIAIVLLLMGQRVEAQVREPDHFLTTSVTLSSAPRLRQVSTRHASPMLAAGFRLSEHSQLRLDWGLPYTSVDPAGAIEGRRSHLGSSNLLVGLHNVRAFVDDTVFVRMGVGVAVPLARHQDADELDARRPETQDANYTTAAAVRGLADPWLWALDTTSVVLPMAVGLDLPGFQLRADVALGMLVPVSRTARDTHFVAQASLEAALGLGMLEPGARVQVVTPHLTEATWDGEDSRVSLEPFVRVRLGPAFARAGVRIDLGDPRAHPAPSASRMWALGLGLGVGF